MRKKPKTEPQEELPFEVFRELDLAEEVKRYKITCAAQDATINRLYDRVRELEAELAKKTEE